MTPPADPVGPPVREPELARFSLPVRWVHGTAGVLVLVCIVTAALLYNGSLQVLVGHRNVVEQVHVWCGYALPVPLLAGLLSGTYRADLRRLNRFTGHDWHWLRSRTRREGTIPVGKFNAGQKLNGALSGGAIAVLVVSGTVMLATGTAPLAWRTGATLMHDWFALAVGLLVLGHLRFALSDPVAMRGMWTGSVPRAWARAEHGAWAAELSGPAGPADRTAPPPGGGATADDGP